MWDMTYAQACGEEAIPGGYVYTAEDLAEDMSAGDYDPEDFAATLRLVGERDLADRNRALEAEVTNK